jgi:hypothetical protein
LKCIVADLCRAGNSSIEDSKQLTFKAKNDGSTFNEILKDGNIVNMHLIRVS